MGQDFAFIRLKPSFSEAKEIYDPKQSNYRYYDCIQLAPDEHYFFITNSPVNIVLNNDCKVTLIDQNEVELKDITDNVTISEGTDKYGIRQIGFEIVNIGQSFYGDPVYLKIEHTTGTEVFYSNPFTVSDQHLEDTFRLAFKSYGWYQGTDYTNFPFYQKIRISCEFLKSEDQTDNSQYIQVNGGIYSQNPTLVFSESFRFNEITDQTFRALAVALKSDEVYFDGFRSTNKPQIKNGDRLLNSNNYNAEVTVYIDRDQVFSDTYQITPEYFLLDKNPKGSINDVYIETSGITLYFSKKTVLGTGSIRLFKEDGTFVHAWNETEIEQVSDLEFNIDGNIFESYIDGDFGNYYFNVDLGLFSSIIGDQFQIINDTDWTFAYSAGFYDPVYYDQSYYLV